MKEATGELNITVITIIAIAAIATLFYTFVWPSIKGQLTSSTCKSFGPDYVYDKNQKACCKGTTCIPMDDKDM